MINFDLIEAQLKGLSEQFRSAKPFEHLLIDNFCDEVALDQAIANLPSPQQSGLDKSGDFIFAKNKYIKTDFELLSPSFRALKENLLSERFKRIVNAITDEDIFVDPDFHGGGLHQGGENSFLNMHVDFNYHPDHSNWFRNINFLLYLNKDWRPDYGGQLKLRDGRDKDATVHTIDPLFNRAVLMFTRDYTYHGYDPINFPKGEYRSSIAAYGYSIKAPDEQARTTVWYPEQGGILKKALGKNLYKILMLKSKFFGAKTTKNK